MQIHPSPPGQRMCTTHGVHVRDRVSRAHARLALLVLVLLTVLCTGCAKTVKWEEEVLLNTGETIWVSKKVRYSIKGQPGNPLDLGYLPDQAEVLSFHYRGKSYLYEGNARIQLLAISPDYTPTLVLRPSSNEWYYENSYKCVTPYYAQLIPDSSGQMWTWPDRIEPWIYNLPTNLLLERYSPSVTKHRYGIREKENQLVFRDPQLLSIQKIDPLYVADHCKGGK